MTTESLPESITLPAAKYDELVRYAQWTELTPDWFEFGDRAIDDIIGYETAVFESVGIKIPDDMMLDEFKIVDSELVATFELDDSEAESVAVRILRQIDPTGESV